MDVLANDRQQSDRPEERNLVYGNSPYGNGLVFLHESTALELAGAEGRLTIAARMNTNAATAWPWNESSGRLPARPPRIPGQEPQRKPNCGYFCATPLRLRPVPSPGRMPSWF